MRQNLQRDKVYEFDDNCKAEFDRMIECLTTAPVLQALDVNKESYVYSDSSYQGCGFGIFQQSDVNPKLLAPCAYGGQAFGSSHRKWTTLQIELYGVFLCLKTYHNYFCLLYTSPSPRDGLLSR